MIRNNLAKLMLERNLKATQVSNRTKIARSTLSRISNNASEKIEYSTINSLCDVLKVTPCEFFEYLPLNDSFTFEIGNTLTTKAEYSKGMPMEYEVFAFINFTEYGESCDSIEYTGTATMIPFIDSYEMIISLKADKNADTSIFNKIPISFQNDIIERLRKYIENQEKENFTYTDFFLDIELT